MQTANRVSLSPLPPAVWVVPSLQGKVRQLTRSASNDMAWMAAARWKGWISMMLKTKLCPWSPDSTTL